MTRPKEDWRDYPDQQLPDKDAVYHQQGWTALFAQEDWWTNWLGAGFFW
jgi:hypothetical protein